MKNPLLVAARNAAMRYTNIPDNDLKSIHDYDVEDAIKIHINNERYTPWDLSLISRDNFS